MRPLLLSMLLAGTAACAPARSYMYHPAEQATATLDGRAAARYGLPPEAPRGSARVATFGVTTVETDTGTASVLHVRLVVANNNDAGRWVLDTGALRAAIAGQAPVGPTFLDRHGQGPEIEIPPGDAATVDAYFALPEGVSNAAGVPRFDLIWEVGTPGRTVVERTPFERIALEPSLPPRMTVGAGFGLYGYDPFFAPGAPIIIERRPRVYTLPPGR